MSLVCIPLVWLDILPTWLTKCTLGSVKSKRHVASQYFRNYFVCFLFLFLSAAVLFGVALGAASVKILETKIVHLEVAAPAALRNHRENIPLRVCVGMFVTKMLGT